MIPGIEEKYKRAWSFIKYFSSHTNSETVYLLTLIMSNNWISPWATLSHTFKLKSFLIQNHTFNSIWLFTNIPVPFLPGSQKNPTFSPALQKGTWPCTCLWLTKCEKWYGHLGVKALKTSATAHFKCPLPDVYKLSLN